MFTYRPTNTKFENRKEAVKVMGMNRYRRALKNKEFDFNNE